MKKNHMISITIECPDEIKEMFPWVTCVKKENKTTNKYADESMFFLFYEDIYMGIITPSH